MAFITNSVGKFKFITSTVLDFTAFVVIFGLSLFKYLFKLLILELSNNVPWCNTLFFLYANAVPENFFPLYNKLFFEFFSVKTSKSHKADMIISYTLLLS